MVAHVTVSTFPGPSKLFNPATTAGQEVEEKHDFLRHIKAGQSVNTGT